MTITTTFTALRKANACKEGYRKLADHLGGVSKYGANTPIPVSTILDSNGLDDVLWVFGNDSSVGAKPVMVQWAIDCAERVIHLYTDDDRPRKAIEAARAWLDNPCDTTRDAARAAYADTYAAYAAYAAAYAVRAAVRAAAYAAADAAAYAAADSAAYAAAYADEREWQINRLKELLNS